MTLRPAFFAALLACAGCGAGSGSDAGTSGPVDSGDDAGMTAPDSGALDAGDDAGADAGLDAGIVDAGPNPWADEVVSFTPGPGAGYGQDQLPQVVLGPPYGAGDSAGSTDVLSLGDEGEIVLEFTDEIVVDGPGTDFIVFENPFIGWIETGIVSVSDDGVTWYEFPCAAVVDGGTEGCAGVHPVYSNPDNGISATDPAVAGGDDFDLAQLGVPRARYVRIRDSGVNKSYAPPTGGFDLDALAVVNAGPP